MAERSVVAPVRSMDDRFWFWSERNVDEIVRFAGDCVDVHATPETEATEDGEDREAVLEAEEDDQDQEDEDEESDDDDDSGEEDESDDDDDSEEEEESDGEFDVSSGADVQNAFLLQKVHARKFVPEARFLRGSATEFVAAGRTGGFMRVAAADEENEGGGGERQILVHYRYTRFSAAWSSDGSVQACGSMREHQLRFIAAAGHGARSLAWAGASLAHLIYPDSNSSKRLPELWTRLASKVSLPPGAARVDVFVEVGILRKANCTEASMGHMRDALKKNMMAQTWPERFTGMELNLPEPVRCGHDADKAAHDKDTYGEEQKPAKRRRVVTAAWEDCSVCYEPLEGDDLAAWPGCAKPHVLHGACMQGVLESNPLCPMCRRGLDIDPKF